MVNVALIGNNIRWSAGYAETCLSGVGSARGRPTIGKWQGALVRLHEGAGVTREASVVETGWNCGMMADITGPFIRALRGVNRERFVEQA